MSHRTLLPSLSFLLLSANLAACASSASAPTSPSVSAAAKQNEAASAPPPPGEPGPSPQEIKAVVDGSEPDVRQCYIAGTFKDAQLAGTVSVTFTIETSGLVSQAIDSGSSLPDPEVVDCVVEVFTKLEFRPGGAGPTEVTYPISFGSHG